MPLNQSSIRSYACTVVEFDSTSFSSTLQGIIVSQGWRIRFPALASFHSTIPRLYVLEPTCRCRPLLLFVCQPFYVLSRFLSLSLWNISITFACLVTLTKLSCFVSPPRLRLAVKIQMLTPLMCLPVLTTDLCFKRSSDQII